MSSFNFSAGPAMLPAEVACQLQQSLTSWDGAAHGLLGMSHRSQLFADIIAESEALVRQLLQVPDSYHVLWLPGGASLQFPLLPMNLLTGSGQAGYVLSGYWGQKAFDQAQKLHNVIPVASGADARRGNWQVDPALDYVHICLNETIDGALVVPAVTGNVPVVADATSCLFSWPVAVKDFDLIYAGSQKNLGIPGLTLVLLSPKLLACCRKASKLDRLFSYAQYAEHDSLLNTPATITWATALLMLRWKAKQGGVAALARTRQDLAQSVYQALDQSNLFHNNVAGCERSPINIVFTTSDQALDDRFVAFAAQRGLYGLAGHRSRGGLRASLYNAMPEAGVRCLLAALKDFEESYGS